LLYDGAKIKEFFSIFVYSKSDLNNEILKINSMKKLYFLLIAFIGSLIFSSNIYAQCTPDPDCVDTQGDGEYCPTEFPNAVEDEYYDQTLTVIAPTEQGGFTLHHIEVLNIGNIPPGMNYQCQNDNCSFYPATPKCISIYGTPEVGSWGEYNLHLSIEIFIDVVGNPVSIGTFTDSSAVVFIEPQLYGNFLIDGTTPNEVCNNFPINITYTGNASENATYHWNFGEHITVLEGEGQGPYTIEYNDGYAGIDSISLYVEEDIYTSPTYSISYITDICEDVSTVSNQDIHIYPNPFDGQLEIRGLKQDGTIRIFDLTAKEVFSSELNQEHLQFDLESLQSGVYLVSIITENAVTTQKIVKR